MDARYWDERYEASELVWSAGPNATVAEQVSDLQPGTALDLGSGEGRNTVWLAEHGWTVTAVDFSPVATDKALAAAAALQVTIDAVTADVTTYQPQRSFDLVLAAYLQLPWDQLGPVLATAAASVAPGGMFLLIAHDLSNLEDGVGGPQDPAVLPTPDQVAGALGGLRVTTAERIRRPVEQEGRTVHAIDTLVRASAP